MQRRYMAVTVSLIVDVGPQMGPSIEHQVERRIADALRTDVVINASEVDVTAKLGGPIVVNERGYVAPTQAVANRTRARMARKKN